MGLAIAAELADGKREVLVLERHESFGQEASSRNSEVIHAGVYYPPGSLRARLCVEGNALLYKLCEEAGIPFARPGKLLVAVDEAEESALAALRDNAAANGVKGLALLSGAELKEREPELCGRAALYVPATGIIDSHKLMACLEGKAKAGAATLAYGTELVGVSREAGGLRLGVKEADGGEMTLGTRVLINSGGLGAVKVAELAGIDVVAAGHGTYLSKGEFFRVGGSKHKLVKHLVYPTPKGPGYTGAHTISDLDGAMKLGPFARTVEQIDYTLDDSDRAAAWRAARRFLPFIEDQDLTPDMSGIQAKLGKPGDGWHDFVIREESERGLPGLVNLIGIDSPGLTAAIAIAAHVASLLD